MVPSPPKIKTICAARIELFPNLCFYIYSRILLKKPKKEDFFFFFGQYGLFPILGLANSAGWREEGRERVKDGEEKGECLKCLKGEGLPFYW